MISRRSDGSLALVFVAAPLLFARRRDEWDGIKRTAENKNSNARRRERDGANKVREDLF